MGYVLQILDGNITADSDATIEEMEGNMHDWSPACADLRMWVQDVRHTISSDRRGRSLMAHTYFWKSVQ